MLATSKLESFAIFLYADLQWTTGDGSSGTDGLGGTEALGGINAGDGINSFTIPGSLPRASSTLLQPVMLVFQEYGCLRLGKVVSLLDIQNS